jgi:hypothetical protein
MSFQEERDLDVSVSRSLSIFFKVVPYESEGNEYDN